MSSAVPFHRPAIGEGEVAAAVESLTSGWLTTGPKTQEFEERFAAAVRARYAVALNSATAALHLSLAALDIGPGDEVIIPTMTFASAAEVVLAVGATPVLVDSVEGTLAIDTDAAIEQVTEKTRAIMPMHYGGVPVDLGPLMKIAAESPQISIVEDAAHAFPASGDYGPLGGQSHGACFSFYANKTITTGEGGMFTTNDEAFADRVRRLSLHGLSRSAWKRFETRSAWDYDIVEPGWKYNMTDLAAAIGVAQLDRAADMRDQRHAIATEYDDRLGSIEGITPIAMDRREGSACHLYVIRLDAAHTGVSRSEMISHLMQEGIGTSVHYRPLHMHSYYERRFGYHANDFPVAAATFNEIVSIPLYPGMTKAQVDRVVQAISSLIEKRTSQ